MIAILGAALGAGWLAWSSLRPSRSGPPPDRRPAAAEASGPVPGAAPDAPPSLSRSSAASPADSSLPGPDGPDAPTLDVAACLALEDPAAFRACVASRLGPQPDARAIARLLCRRSRSHDANRILLGEALLRTTPARALEWIGAAEAGCPRLLGWGDLEEAFASCEARDPDWFQAFRQTVSPESLFDPRSGEAGILVSVAFLKQGDLEMRAWIEKGARGDFGGTSSQMDRAIGAGLVVQGGGEERLGFLASVLASPGVSGEAGIGATFALQLIDVRSWPGGEASSALDLLTQVLYDPRFQESAAATICLQFSADPPAGCDPDQWSEIEARSLEIAHAIGLVIPERR